MAINLNASGIGKVQLNPFIADEVALTQSGKHVRKVHAVKERIQLQINVFQQSGDNAVLSNWLALINSDSISYNSKNWVVEGFEIDTLNDANASDMLRLLIILVEKG